MKKKPTERSDSPVGGNVGGEVTDSYVELVNSVLKDAWDGLPNEIKMKYAVLDMCKISSAEVFKQTVFMAVTTLLPPNLSEVPIGRLIAMHQWRVKLLRVASTQEDLTLLRAIHNGLLHDLVIRRTFETECHAWALSGLIGTANTYNSTQTIPGYQKACNSVHAAVDQRRASRDGNAQTKGIIAKQLASALLSYWLPLGLWAMTPIDALEALRRLTVPNVYSKFSGVEVERVRDRDFPEWRSSVLRDIKPKERAWHSRFSSAVSDQGLYRAKSAMIGLSYAGDTLEGRGDVENWRFAFKPGFDCSGRW